MAFVKGEERCGDLFKKLYTAIANPSSHPTEGTAAVLLGYLYDDNLNCSDDIIKDMKTKIERGIPKEVLDRYRDQGIDNCTRFDDNLVADTILLPLVFKYADDLRNKSGNVSRFWSQICDPKVAPLIF